MPMTVHKVRILVIALAPFFLLAACASIPAPGERTRMATQRAAAAGLLPVTLTTGPLPLQGFAKMPCPGEPLHVYIEGDGYAWVSYDRPSPDPTPVNPVALALAVSDPACNVAYLGRPGQYLAEKGEARYWLSARFAPEVVDSYAAVIGTLAREGRASALHLAGYSGGGGIAALVAARLAPQHVGLTLSTIAGNLDTEVWTKRLRLSPLAGSLNPATAAAALGKVPQLHLAGTRDRQVPPAVLEAFLAQLPAQQCVRVIRIDTGHAGPWEAAWRQAQASMPACAAASPAFQEPNRPPREEKP